MEEALPKPVYSVGELHAQGFAVHPSTQLGLRITDGTTKEPDVYGP